MGSNGLIYTAIIGDYETPRPVTVKEDGVTYWMFGAEAEGWKHIPWTAEVGGATKAARSIKVNAPLLFPHHDWYLWLDGSMQIRRPILPLIESFEKHFAAFRHPEWDCPYEEVKACIARRKDEKKNLDKAWQMLKDSKVKKHSGQLATGVLWRRGNAATRTHAQSWWSAMKATTMRDQCTFMRCLHKCGYEIEWLPGLHTKNSWVDYRRGHR